MSVNDLEFIEPNDLSQLSFGRNGFDGNEFVKGLRSDIFNQFVLMLTKNSALFSKMYEFNKEDPELGFLKEHQNKNSITRDEYFQSIRNEIIEEITAINNIDNDCFQYNNQELLLQRLDNVVGYNNFIYCQVAINFIMIFLFDKFDIIDLENIKKDNNEFYMLGYLLILATIPLLLLLSMSIIDFCKCGICGKRKTCTNKIRSYMFLLMSCIVIIITGVQHSILHTIIIILKKIH